MANLKVITGPMWSGKSEELLRLIHRYTIAGLKVGVFKPSIDTRVKGYLVTRKQEYGEAVKHPAIELHDVRDLINTLKTTKYDVLVFDEAQFLDEQTYAYIKKLLETPESNIQILIGGLDMDYAGNPFGFMPQFMGIANVIEKATAICVVCKKDAVLTQKLVKDKIKVQIGDGGIYEPRCRKCHDPVSGM